MKKRIIFVDDEPNVLQGLRRSLRHTKKEWESCFVDSGKEALAMVETFKPDLIVCDVMMPNMNGYELLNLLRQDDTTAIIPFIFLTGNNDKPSMRKGMELGADDYLTKPCTSTDLISAIKTRFEKKAYQEKHSREKLDELRRNIVFSLPHELRTPLTGIQGIAEVLMDSGEDMEADQIVQLAESIYESSIRFERLIENYLIYAQIEIFQSDQNELRALRTASISVAGSIITETSKYRAKKVGREKDLHLNIDEHTVHVSEENLKKIVEELVDNALKFSEPGTPVRITAKKEKENYSLKINNQGRGMTKEQIFEIGAYMQFERQLYEQQGSGMGLVIAKRLAELHNGNFSIQSVPNKDITVRVDLPT